MSGKTRVLAVSCDPVLMSFLQKELNSFEYEIIRTEHNGAQLEDVLETVKPEFIIIDIVMPSLDGIGTCLQLRQWTQTPVVMLSTWGTGNGTVRGLDLCSDCYLTEPFGPEALKTRIEETLKRSMAAFDPLSNLPTRRSAF